MTADPRYWFPAKRYGWGWGPPVRWEGWAVMAVFLVLFYGGAIYLLSAGSWIGLVGYATVLILALFAVCWWKGEPPRWRWGDK
jgi:hypothetical protein